MSVLNNFARANEHFAAHVPMVSQLTRYATPIAVRNFSQLYETAAFSYRTISASGAPSTILAHVSAAVEELRLRVEETHADLNEALAANTD